MEQKLTTKEKIKRTFEFTKALPLIFVWFVGFIPGILVMTIYDGIMGIFNKRKIGEVEEGAYSSEVGMAEGNFFILVSGAVISIAGAIWGAIKIF